MIVVRANGRVFGGYSEQGFGEGVGVDEGKESFVFSLS